jgi:hypothetical protein
MSWKSHCNTAENPMISMEKGSKLFERGDAFRLANRKKSLKIQIPKMGKPEQSKN